MDNDHTQTFEVPRELKKAVFGMKNQRLKKLRSDFNVKIETNQKKCNSSTLAYDVTGDADGLTCTILELNNLVTAAAKKRGMTVKQQLPNIHNHTSPDDNPVVSSELSEPSEPSDPSSSNASSGSNTSNASNASNNSAAANNPPDASDGTAERSQTSTDSTESRQDEENETKTESVVNVPDAPESTSNAPNAANASSPDALNTSTTALESVADGAESGTTSEITEPTQTMQEVTDVNATTSKLAANDPNTSNNSSSPNTANTSLDAHDAPDAADAADAATTSIFEASGANGGEGAEEMNMDAMEEDDDIPDDGGVEDQRHPGTPNANQSEFDLLVREVENEIETETNTGATSPLSMTAPMDGNDENMPQMDLNDDANDNIVGEIDAKAYMEVLDEEDVVIGVDRIDSNAPETPQVADEVERAAEASSANVRDEDTSSVIDEIDNVIKNEASKGRMSSIGSDLSDVASLGDMERRRTIETECLDDCDDETEYEMKREREESRELSPIDEDRMHAHQAANKNGATPDGKGNGVTPSSGTKRAIFGMVGVAIVVGAAYGVYALVKQHYDSNTDAEKTAKKQT